MHGRRALERAAELGIEYVESVPERPVAPAASLEELRETLDLPLPEAPTDAVTVVEELARDVEPGLTQMGGGRYFGFVIGGSVPAALAADWLTSAWDQNAGLALPTPAAAVVEEVAGRWVKELLGLPTQASFAFVTGCQMAHATALLAARHHVLMEAGHDVERDGLTGAPPIAVVAGAKRHGTLDRALRFVGLGTSCVRPVAVDDQGRMLIDELRAELARTTGPTIVCSQAGEVSTGAFDDIDAVAELAREHGAWHHVDGAFGLWAAASPRFAPLVAGGERADSWAVDAHKWLNVPYDCALAIVADPAAHARATALVAPYLAVSAEREPNHYVPEASRRARAVPVYAALRALGRDGVAALVERCCDHATLMAALLAEGGMEVLNDVMLNQVLVAGSPAHVARIQDDGTCWLGGTVWRGQEAIRVALSNWSTTEADVRRSAAAILATREPGV